MRRSPPDRSCVVVRDGPTIRTTSKHVRALLREAAARARGRGRWRRGGCPICGAGKRWDDALAVREDGYVHCHRCGTAVHLGERPGPTPREHDVDAERRREAALAIVERSTAIEPGGPVDRYLRGRGLRPAAGGWPPDLRQARSKHPTGAWLAAMVAVVRSASGVIVGVHRTFVRDGWKARVKPVRLSLGSIRGGAVRLGPDSDRIVVAEGIESAIAASMLVPDAGTPWAALSAGGLEALIVPALVHRVTIAMDHDERGVLAARRLCKRLRRDGVRDVRLLRASTPGADACDVIGGAP